MKERERKISAVWWGLFILLSSVFLSQKVFALEERMSELIEGAKKEGKMIFYASMGQQDCTALLQKFEAKYPFVKTELSRLNAERLLIKLLAEAKANHHAADVIINGGFRTHIAKKSGILMKYVSPESKAYPEGYRTDTYNRDEMQSSLRK